MSLWMASLRTVYPLKASFGLRTTLLMTYTEGPPSPLAPVDHRHPWEQRALGLGGIPTSCSFSPNHDTFNKQNKTKKTMHISSLTKSAAG